MTRPGREARVDFGDVAIFHKDRRLSRKPDTGRRAGCDDITRLERDACREKLDQFRNAKDQLSSGGVLHYLASEPELNTQIVRISDLIFGCDERTHRCERVARFSALPLAIGELKSRAETSLKFV